VAVVARLACRRRPTHPGRRRSGHPGIRSASPARRCRRTLLLACKLIVVAFLVNGQLGRLPGHFLPFFSVLDRAGSRSAFQHGLQAAFLVAAVALVLNRVPHLAAAVAGATILVGTLSSRIYFENNTEYTGLILLLAGLAVSGDRTRAWSATRWCCSTPPPR
jgi:hypothetical protein